VIGIVVSRADRASEHIGRQLLDQVDWQIHTDDSRPDSDGGGTFYRREGFELREFEAIHIELESPKTPFRTPKTWISSFSSLDTPARQAHC